VEQPFFDPTRGPAPGDVLVALLDSRIVGYVRLGRRTPLESNAHVLEVRGLAVSASARRRGVGRALLGAAASEAAARGGRRLRLRVLSHNLAARALYEACGFTVDGVLRDEFLLGGRYVDDVMMSRALG
jgi:ribosomal protein S18 acetylase RimI-like enzyme